MKKSAKIALGITLGLGIFTTGLFSQQMYTKATTDWQTNAINNANSAIGKVGYDEKTKLVNSASSDINAKIQDEIGNDIQTQQTELQALLDQYYQDKINNLTNTQSYKDLESQITQIQSSILARYKTEIDQVFAAQGQ